MKKIIKIFMVMALAILIKPMIVQADTNTGLFRADNSITVNDKMDGTGFVAGNMVTINNEVDGMLFAAGNIVNVTTTSDYLFAAGSTVTVSESRFKDGFVAGSVIEFNNVAVDRDLYVGGQKITIRGLVGRNLFVSGDEVIIDGVINNDVYVDATTLVINSNAVINGKVTYNEDAKLEKSKDAIIGSTSTYKNASRSTQEIDTKSLTKAAILNKLISVGTGYINILIVGLLMALLIPRLFKKLEEVEVNKLLPSFAWGLLILITVPVVALIAIFTYVGIATGIIALVLYGLLAYISTIFSTYVITSLLLKNKVKNPYLILLIGLTVLYLIKLVPFAGGLISFALLCLGLGLLTNIYKRK